MRVKPLLGVALVVLALGAPAFAQAPASGEGKPGGVLRLVHREDLPQGFAIHETATNSVTWPAMPCYSNLVIFDQLKRIGRMETIVPELAERWSWQDNYRNLVFFLRRDVRWHDGQPFTSKDVKFTFDLVREAKDAPTKLRLNPRKEWYANVEAIEAPDPYTVVFRLKRPQPSLIAMLASGYSPVLPAHVPLAEHRSRCVGTGPFKFKEWKRGQSVELVKNPDYFVKGRPYLDGLRYVVIVERGTRVAALQTGQVDVAYPGDTTVSIAEQLRGAVPQMVVHRDRDERQRESAAEYEAAAVRQRQGSPRPQPGHRPSGLREGRALRQRARGRGHGAQALGRVGAPREGYRQQLPATARGKRARCGPACSSPRPASDPAIR